jgi:hypothetical protein
MCRKRVCLLALLIVFLFLPVGAIIWLRFETDDTQPAKGDKWKELAPKGGGFSVQVPGDAAEGDEAIEVEGTKERFSGKIYTVKHSRATFEVHYRDFSDEWLKKRPIEQLLMLQRYGGLGRGLEG